MHQTCVKYEKLLGTPRVPKMCSLSFHMNGGSYHAFH